MIEEGWMIEMIEGGGMIEKIAEEGRSEMNVQFGKSVADPISEKTEGAAMTGKRNRDDGMRGKISSAAKSGLG
jgi:hypothetical protein